MRQAERTGQSGEPCEQRTTPAPLADAADGNRLLPGKYEPTGGSTLATAVRAALLCVEKKVRPQTQHAEPKLCIYNIHHAPVAVDGGAEACSAARQRVRKDKHLRRAHRRSAPPASTQPADGGQRVSCCRRRLALQLSASCAKRVFSVCTTHRCISGAGLVDAKGRILQHSQGTMLAVPDLVV